MEPRSVSRDWLSFLGDMVDALDRVQEFTMGMTRNDFIADHRSVYAVEWAFEIAGEAAKYIPEEVRDRHPEIDWRGLAAFRDILAHGPRVDPRLVWNLAGGDAKIAHRLSQRVLALEVRARAEQ